MADLKATESSRGTRLGPYEVVAALGTGAAGTVFRARAVDDDAPVAIKRMSAPALAPRYEIESRLLSQLRHPGVVRILDHFEQPSGVYNIVMQLVDGTDLAKTLWDRGTPGLPVTEVLDWAGDVCEALQYLHEQQIVHGDLKPANLVRGRGRVVLVDFGLAARLDTASASNASGGTPRFMAPEVFAGDAISTRSDIYGLAASMWNLIAGEPPSYGEDRPLAGAIGDVRPELETTLRAALEIRPEDRVASAVELADALGSPILQRRGASLAVSLEQPGLPRGLIEAVVRAAAGVFDAAAASIALRDPATGGLLYVAAWGAGAREVLGMRLDRGVGIAADVLTSGDATSVPSCRTDARFAARVASGTGYVPYTMLVLPLRHEERTVGVLSVLDRRDGEPYGPGDIPRGELFADVAAAALA